MSQESKIKEESSSPNIKDLKENFLEQQEKISALKEMVRKSESAQNLTKNATKEKVKDIAEKLLKSKARSQQLSFQQNASTTSSRMIEDSPAMKLDEEKSSRQHTISQISESLNISGEQTSTPLKENMKDAPDEGKTTVDGCSTMISSSSSSKVAIKSTKTINNDKILLMRQQLEENRLKLAKKASSKQHLEQLFTQLKEKLDTTQQCLEDTTEMGRSMNDLSALSNYSTGNAPAGIISKNVTIGGGAVSNRRNRPGSTVELGSTHSQFNLDKERIKFLENRCRLLERQLEKEKQQNSQICSNKINDYSSTNENLEEKCKQLQQKTIELEEENEKLRAELQQRENELNEIKLQITNETKTIKTISNIDDNVKEKDNQQQQQLVNDFHLENECLRNEIVDNEKRIQEQAEMIVNLEKEQEMLNKRILELEQSQIVSKNMETSLDDNPVNKETTNNEYDDSKSIMEETKCQQQQQTIDNERDDDDKTNTDDKLDSIKPTRRIASPTSLNLSENLHKKIQAVMANEIQELRDELEALRKENVQLQDKIKEQEHIDINDTDIMEKIVNLENKNALLSAQMQESSNLLKEKENALMEKTIELNVTNANFKVLEERMETLQKAKPLFPNVIGGDEEVANVGKLELEIQQLKENLDESNKAMIKMKLKSKQTEKTLQKLKNSSDLHKEVVRLEGVRVELEQRITELEKEKKTSAVEVSSQFDNRKQDEMEILIQDLNRQINELKDNVREKDEVLNARVKTELSEIQLQEEIQQLRGELETTKQLLEVKEKQTIDNRRHGHDNDEMLMQMQLMELLDKIEKPSKSSSSAESIEIVERLTQQEKAEIEAFDKERNDKKKNSTEDVIQTNESSSDVTAAGVRSNVDGVTLELLTELDEELIEENDNGLPTATKWLNDRKNVLAKLEKLNEENSNLLKRLEILQQEKEELVLKVNEMKNSQEKLEMDLETLSKEKDSLMLQIGETQSLKSNTSQELSTMAQSSEVMASLENSEPLFEKCEKSLMKLNHELEAYRKANDKKSKFNICKKLAKEAENAYMQLTELLQKVKEASSAVETVTVVETVVAVTAPDGKALAEYEQLTDQNRELKATIVELRRSLDEAREFSPEKDQNIDELHKRLENYELKLQNTEKQRLEHEERCKTLEMEIEQLTEQLEELKMIQNHEIQELEKESKLKATKNVEEIENLTNKLKMSDRISKELQGKCEMYEKQIEIMQQLVNDLKEELKTNYEVENQKDNDLQESKDEIEQLKETLRTLRESLENAEHNCKIELEKECENLREILRINKSLVQEQLNDLASKEEEIDELTQQLTEKENEIDELNRKFDNNLDEHKKLVNAFKSLEDRNRELITLNKQQKDALNTQEQRLISLEENAQDMERKNEELKQRNDDQTNRLQKYAAVLKKKTLNCRAAEEKLKKIEEEQNQTKQHDRKELENYQKNCEELRRELQETIKQLNDSRKELKEKTKKYKELEENTQNYKELEENTQKYKEFREEMEDKQQQLEIQVMNKEQQIQELENELMNKDHQIQQLETELTNKEQQIQELENNFRKMEKQYFNSQTNIECLNVELEQMKQNMDLKCKELTEFKDHQDEENMNWKQLENTLQQTINNQEQRIKQLQIEMENLETKFQNDLVMAQENYITKERELCKIIDPLEGQSSVWSSENNNSTTENKKEEDQQNQTTGKFLENEETIKHLLEENKLLSDREQILQEKLKELEEASKEKDQFIEHLKNTNNNTSTDNLQIENELHLQLQLKEDRINQLSADLNAKSIKFEKSKAIIKDRNVQIQRLQNQLKDLQEKLSTMPEEEAFVEELSNSRRLMDTSTSSSFMENANDFTDERLRSMQEAYNTLKENYQTEKSAFQATVKRLETLHDGIQAKLKEDNEYIASLEQENKNFKMKICRLEECVALFEDRRTSMEREVKFMDAQMQRSSEAHAKVEDELLYRLNMLLEHDDIIAKRLFESQTEHENIEERYRQLQSNYNELQSKYQAMERDYSTFKTNNNKSHQEELEELQERLSKSWNESDIERFRNDYEKKLTDQKNELDEMENELSEQLRKMNDEKRDLNEKLERAKDECTTLKDDVTRLTENVNSLEDAKSELERETAWLRIQIDNTQTEEYELQELRMQSVLDKSEIQHLCQQLENTFSTHEMELQALRTQISELDSLRMQVGQNQTDDQVFIESENKRLKDLLTEKDQIIANYQRQLMQTQQPGSSRNVDGNPLEIEPAMNSSSVDDTNDNNTNLESLRQELITKNTLLARLQSELNSLRGGGGGGGATTRQSSEPSTIPSPRTDVVIPAPPTMFFSTENTVPTPFDDLIVSQGVESTPSAEDTLNVENSLTIEDLQRNVSDLEKHAHDLEQKLAIRNQRDHENEERDRLLQETQIELNNLREEMIQLRQQNSQIQVLEEELIAKKEELKRLQTDLNERRTQELSKFQDKCQENQILQNKIATLEDQILIVQSKEEEKEEEHEQKQPTPPPTLTLDMFFGQSTDNDNKLEEVFKTVSNMSSQQQQEQQPVIEETIVPKKAYECQPKNEKDVDFSNDSQIKEITVNVDIDNFNWGDEAEAEAEHFDSKGDTLKKTNDEDKDATQHSLITNEQRMELRLQEMQERVQELEDAWNISEKEKQEIQLKCAKLMKKVKDYKQKLEENNSKIPVTNETLFRKSSSSMETATTNSSEGGDFNLDAAIQAELGLQIKSLEEKMEEYKKQEDSWNTEKEKLTKRIEVLTNGNERMLEMKEAQDRMYQSRISELQQQLDHLNDWGQQDEQTNETATTTTRENTSEIVQGSVLDNQSSSEKTNPSNDIISKLENRLAEMEHELKDVCEDRTELQALLEEERLSTNRAEEIVDTLRKQLKSHEESNNTNVQLTTELTSKYNNLRYELQNLQEAYNDLEMINVRLRAEHQDQYNSLLNSSQAKELQLLDDLKLLQLEMDNYELNKKEYDNRLENNTEIINKLEKNNNQLHEENKTLQTQIETYKMKESLQNVINTMGTDGCDDVMARLQEKDAEILHLKQRVSDLLNDDQTEKLILEVIGKNQEIDVLKNQLQSLEENLQRKEIEENENKTLLEQQVKDYEEYNAEIRRLELLNTDLISEKRQMEEELEVLNQHVLEHLGKEDTVKSLMLELDTKNIEIAELTKTIATLRESNSNERGGEENVGGSTDFIALNAQWEAIVDERCGEIARMWQDHLAQRERDYKSHETKLREEINTLKLKLENVDDDQMTTKNANIDLRYNLGVEEEGGSTISSNTQVSEETTTTTTTTTTTASSRSTSQTTSPEHQQQQQEEQEQEKEERLKVIEDREETEDMVDTTNVNVTVEKMRVALESQEMEIVALKEQLAIRSAEYARLAATCDPYKLQEISSEMNHLSNVQQQQQQQQSLNISTASPVNLRSENVSSEDSAKVVPKTELDFAYYMLHQRDMRCEEMNLELVALLEERDTLQLRLSQTLRQLETIKAQGHNISTEAVQNVSLMNETEEGNGGNLLTMEATGSMETMTNNSSILNVTTISTTADDEELNQKLSLLEHVNKPGKEKLTKEESEQQQHLRQLELIQQDVARIPSAAVSELIGTDIETTNEAPTSALFNWLWGKRNNSNSDS